MVSSALEWFTSRRSLEVCLKTQCHLFKPQPPLLSIQDVHTRTPCLHRYLCMCDIRDVFPPQHEEPILSQNATPSLFDTPRAAFWGGVREAFGVPMAVMGASFVGFGSMVHDMEWSVWHGIYSSISTWALPGQIAMAEMTYTGAPLMAVVVAVAFINARLMPLAASLFPHIRQPGVPPWKYYLASMLVAATSWVGTMQRLPDLKQDQRLSYLCGYGLLLYCSSPIATTIGFYLAGQVPLPVTLALVFLNPLYFMLLFLFDLRTPSKVLSLLFGAALGPALYLVVPNWSLIITGLVGGTLAWLFGRSKIFKKGAHHG